ncbi:MAG: 30S ribosomal protein S8 [Candidatus Firestonebacteria bacterium]|nr:30S ribosomal protein S8 [Candidatus Firestonebacteria bacterium]
MSMTDPIADMLIRIRNANNVFHEKVDIPASKLKMEIAKILKNEGYIKNYKYIEDRKQGIIRIYLKYSANKEKVISQLVRISKPGLRVYSRADKLPRVLSGMGTAIISTSCGVMTDRESRKKSIGGEIICYVW